MVKTYERVNFKLYILVKTINVCGPYFCSKRKFVYSNTILVNIIII